MAASRRAAKAEVRRRLLQNLKAPGRIHAIGRGLLFDNRSHAAYGVLRMDATTPGTPLPSDPPSILAPENGAPSSGTAGTPAVPSSSLDPKKQPDSSPLHYCTAGQYAQLRPEFQCAPLEASEEEFRHASDRTRRRQVFAALQQCHEPGSRIDRFVNCGACCTVEYSPARDDYRTIGSYCHDRLCPACGRARAAQIAAAAAAALGNTPLRFVTLTLRTNIHLTLTEQLDRLYTSFRNLRRNKIGKQHFEGGIAFVEITLSKGHWHPHLHCLIEGQYLDQKELSHAWYAVTGDSSIVDIRAVAIDADSRSNAIRYVASYAGKPLGSDVAQAPEKLAEFVTSIKGRRLVFAFGSWNKRVKLSEWPDDHIIDDWVAIGTLRRLVADAASGDVDAKRLLEAIQRRRNIRERNNGPPPLDTA